MSEPANFVANTSQASQLQTFAPEKSCYFDLINTTFKITAQEKERLTRDGIVVSDRIAFDSFLTAYAYIYKHDLPVLVTTDSLLHVVHRAYDHMLLNMELFFLSFEIEQLLLSLRDHLRQENAKITEPRLKKVFNELDIYLTVPLVLLTGKQCDNPDANVYIKLAEDASQDTKILFFGIECPIDFTLFRPRGHYVKKEKLQRYFRAISWLQHVQFNLLVPYDTEGNRKVVFEAVAAATLFRNILNQSGQRERWQDLDKFLNALVGYSEGIRLPGLDQFLEDVGIDQLTDVFKCSHEKLITALSSYQYGIQSIRTRHGEKYSPVTFSPLGARFAIDSYILGQVVFDGIVVSDEKKHRPFPKALDAMYVLGNERGRVHLEGELKRYNYAEHLQALKKQIESFSYEFWQDSLYNHWLTLIRTLNKHPEGNCPPCMRTDAWADKLLHTQLASWAQLRHDNILYVQQSSTSEIICDYPAGYVEPYPAFYKALQDYAKFGLKLFETYTAEKLGLSEDDRWENWERRQAYETTVNFFQKLEEVAENLWMLAEKQLRHEKFSQEEEKFLKSIVVRQVYLKNNICAFVRREEWDGWYYQLFPYLDGDSEIIADVHTNTNNSPAFPELLPPGVLYAGTGPVAGLLCVVDNDGDSTVYVGPSYTYFETIETGYPPVRLTNEDWRQRLYGENPPPPPSWTASFRLPAESQREFFQLPDTIDVDESVRRRF